MPQDMIYQEEKRLGFIFVLCAPSGTGKSTLVHRLLQEFPRFNFSVSCTTRAPRVGEHDGIDYHFLSKEDFLRQKEAGKFAEWAEVHGQLYGTPYAPVRALLEAGKDVLFDVDVQGAKQLRQSFPNGLFVFLLPPNIQELERRLRDRATDSEESIVQRLHNARKELLASKDFDYWVVNDTLDCAYDRLRSAFLAWSLKPEFRPFLVQSILETV